MGKTPFYQILPGQPILFIRKYLVPVYPDLVPPRETLRSFPPPPSPPWCEAVSLPEILCVGHWRSLTPARQPDHDYSWLVVLWFQDDFAFPIDPEVLEHLTGIDWNRLAVDGDY